MRPFTPAPVITAPSPPVRTLRHRNLLWAYRARVFAVHIGDPSSNQATTLESQMIHMIQELFGQTLRRSFFLETAQSDEYVSVADIACEPEYANVSPELRRRILLRASRSAAVRGTLERA